ncbi:ABC transporter ATP-binding protein [Brachybacterium sp. AOP43-C2-M15]|uniref:ABC transporter ATP-binding protein n=1 Tax=Brachybacterium sp. AOP43-C2-M15 TaxID=3457661 RepID=UPI0040345624
MALIEIEGLTKRYGHRTVVDDVSFSVERGEIFGILGPNGAGKTTTVECLEGLRRPDGGRISVAGLDPQRDSAELRHVLGAQLQQSALPERITVGEAMALFASFYRDPVDWRELIDGLHLGETVDRQFRRLSGGQKQRVSVALALVGDPQVAVLDEVTTGLDPQARRDAWAVIRSIRDRGVTVLLVTHFMEEAERLCDRLAVIDAGRLVALDTPTGLIDAVDADQRIRFRPSVPLAESLLTALPQVSAVARDGELIQVTGSGDLLSALVTALAAEGAAPVDLHTERATLDDAFLALTGHTLTS